MRRKTFEGQALSYSQACLVEAPQRWLFVSGQTPTDAEGAAPEAFEDRCRLAWRNGSSQRR